MSTQVLVLVQYFGCNLCMNPAAAQQCDLTWHDLASATKAQRAFLKIAENTASVTLCIEREGTAFEFDLVALVTSPWSQLHKVLLSRGK